MKKKKAKKIKYFIEVKGFWWCKELNEWLNCIDAIIFDCSSCRTFRTASAAYRHTQYLMLLNLDFTVEQEFYRKGQRFVKTLHYKRRLAINDNIKF
jgi:hypothetical protein